MQNQRGRGNTLGAALAAAPSLFTGTKIAAVDRGITAIDCVPERFRGITVSARTCRAPVVCRHTPWRADRPHPTGCTGCEVVLCLLQTLYLSKNVLKSLDGVEQFAQLRALSAADNLLPDTASLQPLAQLGLVAASFEGNPLADLPLYRQHAIVLLGPALQVLDNRQVAEEEREAAHMSVAHEQSMLTLLLTNACVVHKLGRCVQQLRLHTQLQCAVLGGQFASYAAAEGGVRPSGSGISTLLRLWDYEASLGHAERTAIQLAIRREAARQHRRLLASGGKADGSRLWQQAYAAVALKQQETIAELMRLLEEAKAQAAVVLAPITRPTSPVKRREVQGGQDADSRLKRERWVLGGGWRQVAAWQGWVRAESMLQLIVWQGIWGTGDMVTCWLCLNIKAGCQNSDLAVAACAWQGDTDPGVA